MRLTQEPHYAFAPDAPSDAARLAEWIEAEIREDGMESSAQETAAVPSPVANDQDPPRRRLLVGAALASLTLHAAAAAAFFSAAALPDYGVLANKSDAISLATTQTVVLDSNRARPSASLPG